MRFEDMTPEMVERAKGCETAEERTAFIRENGIELTDEQLEGIAGGKKFGNRQAVNAQITKTATPGCPRGASARARSGGTSGRTTRRDASTAGRWTGSGGSNQALSIGVDKNSLGRRSAELQHGA